MEILTAFVKENLADTLLNGAGIEVDDLEVDSVTEQLSKVILEKIIWVGILDYIERDTPMDIEKSYMVSFSSFHRADDENVLCTT
jgi:hypothetical protein